MAYYKLGYSKSEITQNGKPPRGTEIRRDVAILESKAVNERRRAERQSAGLTADFKLPGAANDFEDGMVNDPRYYREQLGEKNLGWDEF